MILLAQVVQLLDQLGFAGDPKLLALREQKLLIDQIAQQIGLFLLQFAGGNGLLLGLGLELLRGSIVVRLSDDLVVHPGNNIFHHLAGDRRRLRGGACAGFALVVWARDGRALRAALKIKTAVDCCN